MLERTSRTIFGLIIFAVGLYGLYYYEGDFVYFVYDSLLPCKRTIPYTIGNFDERFGIKEEEFLDAIEQAENIWEKVPALEGRQLFAYDEEGEGGSKGGLEINLIYDYRQQVTDKIEDITVATSETREEYENLRNKYLSALTGYKQDERVYQRRVDSFLERQSVYNSQVSYWNKRGGASGETYQNLQKEGRALEVEFAAIKKMESNLAVQIRNINALVPEVNQLARELNLTAEVINEIGLERGEEFTEGEYIEGAGGRDRTINVYEWDTKEKLVRLLAHELGHAIGLSHIEDPNAVMYYLNQNKNGQLTASDREQLETFCKL